MTEAIPLRQWKDLVRRARLGRTVKGVAMVLATYADADGTRVFPGVARLAFEAEVSYNVAQNALAKLRHVGLIELVRRGTRRGRADEYKLTFGVDLLERVIVPTPTEAEAAIERLRESNRGRYENDLHPTRSGADGAEEGDLHHTASGAEISPAPHGVGRRNESAPHGALHLHPTAWGATTHDLDTTATTHSDQDLSSAVTHSRARGREQDQISQPEDLANRPRCPHGRSPRTDRGVPRCPDCRSAPTVKPPDGPPLSPVEAALAEARAKAQAARLKYHPPRPQPGDVRADHSAAMAAIDAKLASYATDTPA